MLFCRDCKRSEAKRLRKFVAKRLAAEGVRGVRPLVTSCQDVCPGKGTAVTVLLAGEAARTYVVRSDGEARALIRALAAPSA